MYSYILKFTGLSFLIGLSIFIGCDGGSGPSESVPALVQVKVTDGYVIDANVTLGAKQFVYDGNITYESYLVSGANTKDTLLSKGGVHDLNGNSVVDKEDVVAIDMKAPGNYRNINPFTTLLAENKYLSAQELLDHYTYDEGVDFGSIEEVNSFDIDIVQASTGPEGNPEIMRQAAILTLLYSAIKNRE
ncbi:MAG: hypothetical protein B5M52_03825 [Helicobacteraceae bacterium 4484_230]|nr:MAG: hypothetical protein B5M52_03825 [Helicobacteraceae bacterium 4484_230]